MNRSSEILNYKNVNRFSSYFNGNSANINALQDQLEKGNMSNVRSIISHNSAYDFVGNLLAIYDGLVSELARNILDGNISLRDDKKVYGSAIAKPPSRSSKISYVKYTKKDGKTYKRQEKRDFSKREKTFIKNNKHRSNKELVTLFNQYFKNRTTSSVITKKYRS